MAFPGAIIRGLQEDFATTKHCDMRIMTSDGDTFYAHKVVLCYQSKFFENAMKEARFKEGYENKIHLEDKNSSLVIAMLHYLYYGFYNYPIDMAVVDKVFFDIDLWALADEYMMHSLSNYVLFRFNELKNTSQGSALEHVKSTFPSLVQAAYDKTPDTDDQLRPIFVRAATEKILEFLENEKFRQVMEDVPQFAVDLTESLGNEVMQYKKNYRT